MHRSDQNAPARILEDPAGCGTRNKLARCDAVRTAIPKPVFRPILAWNAEIWHEHRPLQSIFDDRNVYHIPKAASSGLKVIFVRKWQLLREHEDGDIESEEIPYAVVVFQPGQSAEDRLPRITRTQGRIWERCDLHDPIQYFCALFCCRLFPAFRRRHLVRFDLFIYDLPYRAVLERRPFGGEWRKVESVAFPLRIMAIQAIALQKW